MMVSGGMYPVRTMLLTDQQNSIQHMKMSRWTLHGKRVPLICISQSQWPINRDFAARKDDSVIPSNEILKKYRGMVQEIDVHVDEGVHNLLDPYSTNYWDKLIKRTHTLLSFAFRRQGVSDASLLERAEMLWFRYAMKETKKAHSDGHLKKLYL